MDATTIKFANKTEKAFANELRERVDAYFKERGISQKANAAMVLKTIVILTLTFGSYGLILTGWFTPLQMLGLAVLMGVGAAGTGFCVSHDALHGAYSNNKRVNSLLGMTFDILGANGYLWKITHNVIHHTYTNIQGIDEDLEVSPLLRLSPASEYRPIHRFQHYYGLLTYSMSTLFWMFAKDFKYILQRDLGPYENIQHPKKEVAFLIVSKLFVYAYMIVLPLLLLDITWWHFVIGFLAMHLTAGFILGVIFQLAHVVEGTDHFTSAGQTNMPDSWLVHELRTTADFAQKSKLLCWYVGGLNFQIEHHLFPKVCSIHYPAISPIVKEVVEKHGLPYNSHETLGEAVRSHIGMLKVYSRPEAVLAA